MFHVITFRNFAEDIYRLRKDSDISQDVLAEKSGINKHTISRVERGLSYPSVDTLRHIADAISEKTGVPVFLLLNSSKWYDLSLLSESSPWRSFIKSKIDG